MAKQPKGPDTPPQTGATPGGLWTKFPVASALLPVKWEQSFPKVLLALVYDVCRASCHGGHKSPQTRAQRLCQGQGQPA